MTGSTNKLSALLAREKDYLLTVNGLKTMERVRREQKAILEIVRETGKQNDLDTTIKVEKRFMVSELTLKKGARAATKQRTRQTAFQGMEL